MQAGADLSSLLQTELASMRQDLNFQLDSRGRSQRKDFEALMGRLETSLQARIAPGWPHVADQAGAVILACRHVAASRLSVG